LAVSGRRTLTTLPSAQRWIGPAACNAPFAGILDSRRQDNSPLLCHISKTRDRPTIAVPGTSLVVQLSGEGKPSLTVDELNLSFRVEPTRDGRIVTLALITICKNEKN